MPEPYYSDHRVTLYHGDCREVTDWLAADVLVTDPPYGIGYRRGRRSADHGLTGHGGISGDSDATARDAALGMWGSGAALVFGSQRVAFPAGWRRMLVFEKPTIGCGLFGVREPWFANIELIFMLGAWPDQVPSRSAVVRTRALAASGYSGYATRAGHAHAKPLDVMQELITACPPGVIADPFAGSGSTLVSAKLLGREAIGVEIEERYCEIAARRLSQDALPFAEIVPGSSGEVQGG